MVRRGSIGRGAALVLVAVAVLIPIGRSSAAPVKTNSLNAKTINVSLPGPFNGCTFLDAGATPTTDAINDLLVPSAFLTTSAGNLYGENGPIASAELTSLTPETIKYTIAPNEKWSNGTTFNGNDLLGWWLRAKSLRTVLSDGYRDIKSLKVSKDADVVTAVFSTPYADWNLLFRDVEALGTQGNCSLAALASRPTLGPYSVSSATSHRIVLLMNQALAGRHRSIRAHRHHRRRAPAVVGDDVLRQLLARRQPTARPSHQWPAVRDEPYRHLEQH